MIHGRVVRPRGQGAYGAGTAPAVLSIDESSIKHIKDAKVVRFGNFVGVVAPTRVRGDPGRGAAEGEVGRPAGASGHRQLLEVDPRAGLRRPGQGGDRLQQRQLRQRVRLGRVHAQPELQDALHGQHVDRPGVLRRRRHAERRAALHQHAERLRHADEHQDGARQGDGHLDAREPHPPDVLRGLERVRPGRSVQRREPGGGDHVRARGQAGAPPVHALGHARLGQLRAGRHGRHPCRCGREGQHHGLRVHRLHAPLLLDASVRAAGDRERDVLGDRRASSSRSAARSTRSRTGG